MAIPHNLSSQIEKLRHLNLSIRQQLEAAEACIPEINEQIAQLSVVGLISDAAFMGPIVYDKVYGAIPSETDGSLLLQTALLVPEGLGIIAWDREAFLAFRGEGPGYREARLQFNRFDQLEGALRALLLPHAAMLLERLLVVVGRVEPNSLIPHLPAQVSGLAFLFWRRRVTDIG